MELLRELLSLAGLWIESIAIEADRTVFTARTIATSARCPICRHPSSAVHSRYTRTIADLPMSGVAVVLRVRVSHFFCNNPWCSRKTFTERLDVAPAYARRTSRVRQTLEEIGFALGGEAGSRLAGWLGMPTSPDTLLNLIRAAPSTDVGTPTILAVDDWAWRKRHNYGTMLVDVGQHRPLDLLPGRSAESFAEWLKAHPGAKIITRDRAEVYADGAGEGAPDAVQVADRWHLLANLRQALERYFIRRYDELPRIEAQAAPEETPPSAAAKARKQSKREADSEARRTRRWARYDEVKALQKQGLGIRAIARATGMNRTTVMKFAHASEFPEVSKRHRTSKLDSYKAYIDRRWQEGCHKGTDLIEEIRVDGYRGSRTVAAEYVTKLRHAQCAKGADGRAPQTDNTCRAPLLSAREASWLMMCVPEKLQDRQQRSLEMLLEACSEADTAYKLSKEFVVIVKEKHSERLLPWLDQAKNSGIRELRSFTNGIYRDFRAVEAAVSLPYSNGEMEGHINRLKLIKRSMYGRAKFDLLRKRVLHHPPQHRLHPLGGTTICGSVH